MPTPNERKTSLAADLQAARLRGAEVFSVCRAGMLYERPIAERQRLIFYLGHLEAFDWNLLCRGHLGQESFHPSFDRLFAFGIDPPVGKASVDTPSDWPSIEEVQIYNRRVREAVDSQFDSFPGQLVRVAIEHRLMHAETLAYLLHRIDYERRVSPPDPPVPPNLERESAIVTVPSGAAFLGRKRDDGFGWDNEFEGRFVDVPEFQIDRYKVTNGDYLEFVRQGAEAPHFWSRRAEAWGLRLMFREISLPLDWPVWVTWDEADAYARWRGKRLPSEAEFHRAAYGGEDPDAAEVHADFHSWDPVSVLVDAGRGPFGTRQMVGNGWEWTSTVFGPFPGFEPFPFYPGYSADFFDGKHRVLKGGSPRTAAPILRRSFRNWFRTDYPYVYAGFRCVEV